MSNSDHDFRNSISHSASLPTFIPLILVVVYFALSPAPKAFGVTPAPDGGYANFNTAEGTDALFNLTSGEWNTAVGFQALYGTTTGYNNTANGFEALDGNTTGAANTAIGANALESNQSGDT